MRLFAFLFAGLLSACTTTGGTSIPFPRSGPKSISVPQLTTQDSDIVATLWPLSFAGALAGDCVDGADAWGDGQADALDRRRDLPRPSDVPRTERNSLSPGLDRRSDHWRRYVYLNSQNCEKGHTMYTVFSIIGSLVLGFVLGMVHKQRVLKKLCRHDGDCVK